MKLTCFVIMPFAPRFDPIFQTVKMVAAKALPGESMECYWLKDLHAAGKITDDIVSALHQAVLCIADVTGNNPNVMWETGYAMALGKPTILIGEELGDLPFDLKVHRIILYSPEDLNGLERNLLKAIHQTLSRYDLKPGLRASSQIAISAPVIAVTGSMTASPSRVRHHVVTMLKPYLSLKPQWYCGSSGLVDQCVLEYLLDHQQSVVAVGYHFYDLSERVRQLVQGGKVRFLDASLEILPKGLTGPSERDIFFLTKADIVILFWNGQSKGTDALVHYFQERCKNLLISFI